MQTVRRVAAFTLVELLVVVAIIAVLIALIMPSLGSAKQVAKRSACLANLHQIFYLFSTYQDSANNGRYPLAYDQTTYAGWNQVIMQSTSGNTDTNNASWRLFVCPNDTTCNASTASSWNISYGFNTSGLAGGISTAPGALTGLAADQGWWEQGCPWLYAGARMADIPRPSEQLVAADAGTIPLTPGATEVGWYTMNAYQDTWSGYATTAHHPGGYCCVSWADGHASAFKSIDGTSAGLYFKPMLTDNTLGCLWDNSGQGYPSQRNAWDQRRP